MGDAGGTGGRQVGRAVAWLLLATALAGCAATIDERYQEATLARRGGDYDAALAGYRAVLAQDPQHAAAHLYVALLLGRQGDRAGAIAHYRAALAGTSSDLEQLRNVTVMSLNNLAYTLAEGGESLPEAEALARRALELSPGRAGLLDTLAVVVLKQGRAGEARDLLERAAELAPEDDAVLEHLADACLAGGDRPAARRALEEALAARPAAPARVRALSDRLDALEVEARAAARVREPKR